jgi:hypothetical protein
VSIISGRTPFAALAEQVLDPLVRAGNVAVQGNRYVRSDVAHAQLDRCAPGNAGADRSMTLDCEENPAAVRRPDRISPGER